MPLGKAIAVQLACRLQVLKSAGPQTQETQLGAQAHKQAAGQEKGSDKLCKVNLLTRTTRASGSAGEKWLVSSRSAVQLRMSSTGPSLSILLRQPSNTPCMKTWLMLSCQPCLLMTRLIFTCHAQHSTWVMGYVQHCSITHKLLQWQGSVAKQCTRSSMLQTSTALLQRPWKSNGLADI